MGIKPAFIYGDLPPNTKMSMAAKFNDPNDPCNVLVSAVITAFFKILRSQLML